MARERSSALAEQRASTSQEVLKLYLSVFLDRDLAGILRESDNEARLLLAIRNASFFDQPAFNRLVHKAVLVRHERPGLAPTTFNIRRRFIFDEGELDKREAVELVERSLRENRIVEKAHRIAGPLRVEGRDWGGFYLDLQRATEAVDAAATPIRTLLLVALPGTLFLLGFVWYFLSRSVIAPIEDLAQVARAVARGDYGRRLPLSGRRDEIGRLAVVVNRMLDLLAEYRDSMEAKVADKTREIERKNRELMLGQRLAATGTLAAGIAHEINNPLNGMLNAARRLRRKDLSEEQKETYIALLEDCIGRIGAIVQKVLSLSPRKMQPIPLDLREEARRTAALVAHQAAKKGVSVEVTGVEPPPRILGETNEVGQIVLNLLINGIDACAAGGHVRVHAGREDGSAMLVVEDDGAGMTPEVAERAFDMFFTTKPAGEGTGLGLATVRSLVTGHGGSLDFASEPGHGTRFTVRLPLLADDEPPPR